MLSSSNYSESYSSAASKGTQSSSISGSEHIEKAKNTVWEYFGFPAENGDFVKKGKKTKRKELKSLEVMPKKDKLSRKHLEYDILHLCRYTYLMHHWPCL